MLLGLFLLLVADALGVVLVLVGLRNGALVLKVLGAAPLASFRVDPATTGGARSSCVFGVAVRKKAFENGHAFTLSACRCVLCLWGNG